MTRENRVLARYVDVVVIAEIPELVAATAIEVGRLAAVRVQSSVKRVSIHGDADGRSVTVAVAYLLEAIRNCVEVVTDMRIQKPVGSIPKVSEMHFASLPPDSLQSTTLGSRRIEPGSNRSMSCAGKTTSGSAGRDDSVQAPASRRSPRTPTMASAMKNEPAGAAQEARVRSFHDVPSSISTSLHSSRSSQRRFSIPSASRN